LTRKLDEEECNVIYKDLKEFIANNVSSGSNSNSTLQSFVKCDLGQTHMSVMLYNAPNLKLTELIDMLRDWRPGTAIDLETQPGNKTLVYRIDVPILVHIKHNDRRNEVQFSSRPSERFRGNVSKPSAEWAMGYVMMLAICGSVVAYKVAVGQAPAFLISMCA